MTKLIIQIPCYNEERDFGHHTFSPPQQNSWPGYYRMAGH